MFCGKEAPGKNEVSFKNWLFEIRLVQGLYSEPVLREAVIKSLKGTAANLVRYMGPQVDIKGIILKLETVYGIVIPFYVLVQSFYKISQDWNQILQHILPGKRGHCIKLDLYTQID